MAGIFDGLEKFGLGNLNPKDLFADPEKQRKEAAAAVQAAPIEIKESDFLFDKTYTCPLCDTEFKVKTVKNGKAKLLGTDLDLRPKHEGIDMLKYDVVLCPNCGYAALSRYFKMLSGIQGKLIKENITRNFKGIQEPEETHSYEEALERYRLALANAVVKRAKASEKAYICLKSGWLMRGKRESLDVKAADYESKKKEYEELEKEYLLNALDGFVAARQKESYPMCGMDETTVDYLLAVLSFDNGRYDVAAKMVSSIITSVSANPRMKDKARELKDMIVVKIKEQKG